MEITDQHLQTLLQTVEKRERTARKRAIMYSIVPIVLAGALIWFTSHRIVQARHELSAINQELDKKRAELNLTENRKRFLETALPNALNDFGWTRDKISKINLDTSIVNQSLQANIELSQISSSKARETRSKITIQYFPKDVDERKVDDALHNLGFRLDKKQPLVVDVPTNSIWFGEKAELEDVKLVAYTLTRAGVQLRAIESFKVPMGKKAFLVQVGASRFVLNEPVFTVEKIRALTFEDLRGKSRTYGDQ